MSILLKMFLAFFKIGLFAVGGGYAAVPLIQSEVVDTYALLSIGEFADLITIAEMTPGPIALNAATFVGMKIAGIPGAVLCSLGVCIMPFIITLALAFVYYRYRKLSAVQTVLSCMRPAVVALIACAGISIFKLAAFGNGMWDFQISNIRFTEIVLFGVGVFLLRKYKVGAIKIIFGTGIIGTIVYLIIEAVWR